MVAADVEQRGSAHGYEEAQVICLQVAAGYHEVVLREAAGAVIVPEVGALPVREQEYLHVAAPFSGGRLSR